MFALSKSLFIPIVGLLVGVVLAADPPKGAKSPKKAEKAAKRSDNDSLAIPVVAPGKSVGDAPSDAVVLFDGKDFKEWMKPNGQFVAWTIQDGAMVCKPGTGSIVTRKKFGDAQMHVEFATPLMPKATSQGRGNSGFYIQGRYELQILDSVNNPTYAAGSCGAIYLQSPPLVNACRQPEQWQSYDIIYHAPKVEMKDGKPGKVTTAGRITILQNGVLIQDDHPITQLTGGSLDQEQGTDGPIMLQDHNNTVRFRNIWVRPLGGTAVRK